MSEFHDIFSELSEGQKDVTENDIVFDIPNGWDNESTRKNLESIGYKVDPYKTIKDGEVNVSLTAKFWRKECPIFSGWENILERIKRAGDLPKEYYVIESSCTDKSINRENSILHAYCKVKRLLVELANHCEPKSGNAIGRDSLLFFIETELSVKKYEFKPDVEWSKLSLIDSPDGVGLVADELAGYIAMGDMQDLERKSVMISALGEILCLASDNKSIFYNILVNIELWKSKYSQHHDLFVQKFRVDKVLSEINQQDLQYTSNINEIISNAQGKALTIPAAFVAVSAIMRIDHYYDSIAVISGLLLSLIIVVKSLNVHKNTFLHIKNQIKSEFKRYVGLDKNSEVRVAANNVEKELSRLVTKSLIGLKFIKVVLFVTFVAAVLYSFLIVNENNGARVASIEKESDHVVTIVNELNVRVGPAKSYSLLNSLKKGSHLSVINKSVPYWYQVQVIDGAGYTGWVYAPFTKKMDLSKLP